MTKQKRFKKVVEKEDGWSMIIVSIFSGILLATHGILCFFIIPLDTISFNIGAVITLSLCVLVGGFTIIISGIYWFSYNIKSRKVYWVEVKE